MAERENGRRVLNEVEETNLEEVRKSSICSLRQMLYLAADSKGSLQAARNAVQKHPSRLSPISDFQCPSAYLVRQHEGYR